MKRVILVIKKYVEVLSKKSKEKEAFEYSQALKYYLNDFDRKFIEKNIDALYSRNSFPVDKIREEEYETYYNIMYVLYHINKNKFDICCKKIKEECDNMSAYRIDSIIKKIEEDKNIKKNPV